MRTNRRRASLSRFLTAQALVRRNPLCYRHLPRAALERQRPPRTCGDSPRTAARLPSGTIDPMGRIGERRYGAVLVNSHQEIENARKKQNHRRTDRRGTANPIAQSATIHGNPTGDQCDKNRRASIRLKRETTGAPEAGAERDIGVSGIGIMAATMSCPPARIIVPANASRIRVSMAFASIQERVSCTARSCEARIRSSPQTGAASETDLGADR